MTTAAPALIRHRCVATRDIERLRMIRNACREFMTRHTDEISPEQQSAWWIAEPRTAWLYDVGNETVGFSNVQTFQGVSWVTLGLLPEWRGRGYGTAIWAHLLETYTPAWAEVKFENVASWRSASKAGWVWLHSSHPSLVIMRTPNLCVCGHGYLEHSGADAWCDACDDEHAFAEAS